MDKPVLNISGLAAGYDERRVLTGVDLSIPQGQLTAIIGPNGHGKSTLLKTISGLLRPSAGTITFQNRRIDGLRPDQIVERGVIHVPQGDMLFPAMTVLDNLLMGAYRGGARTDLNARLHDVFALLPKLKERRRQIAGTLSGGERRMCGIGRGLMAGDGLLMLDEPSLGLAPIVIDQIYEIIFDLCSAGRTILLVEENAQRISERASSIHLLDNGRFVWSGLGTELMSRPEIVEAYLGA